MTASSHWGQKKFWLGIPWKQKQEEKDSQFLTEKNICSVEKENPYTIEKNPEIMLEIEKIIESVSKFISPYL